MAVLNQTLRGATRSYLIPILDANGVGIDVDATFAGYIVTVAYEDGEELKKFSKNARTGFNTDDISVVGDDNNEIRIVLQQEDTKLARCEKVIAHVKLEETLVEATNSDFGTSLKLDLTEFVDTLTNLENAL